MRNLTFILTLCIVFATSCEVEGEEQRSITVTGSAEMDVFPNDIDLQILLRKEITSKTDREEPWKKTEEMLLAALEKAGLEKDALTMGGDNNWYWGSLLSYFSSYYYDYSFAQRTVTLNVSSLKGAEAFMKALKDEGIKGEEIHNVSISRQSHIAITEFRKEVKIKALEMAVEKASYMLEAVGESPGDIISIVELEPEQEEHYWYRSTQETFSNFVVNSGSSQQEEGFGLSPIRLRYEVELVMGIL